MKDAEMEAGEGEGPEEELGATIGVGIKGDRVYTAGRGEFTGLARKLGSEVGKTKGKAEEVGGERGRTGATNCATPNAGEAGSG